MDEVRLGDQTIRYDRSRTFQAYATMKGGTAERCGCLFCQNFLSQRSTVYPQNFLALLDQLGIDPEREGEVYGSSPTPLSEYGGWFYLAGELIDAGERLTDVGSGFGYFFRPCGPVPGFGEDVLALEFLTKLPWVISEKP